jgi:hypothetical protein
MKHLRPYRLFEAHEGIYSDVEDDITDMSQDIIDEDDRFIIYFGGEHERYSSIPKYISISKEKYGSSFQTTTEWFNTRIPYEIDEVEDFLIRLVDYFGNRLIRIKFIYDRTSHGFWHIDAESTEETKNKINNRISTPVFKGDDIFGRNTVLDIKVEFA